MVTHTHQKVLLDLAYFTSREIAAIALCAALWSVLSAYIGPIFWRATHMPFFCDTLGIFSLILVLWWTRKFGAVTLTGTIATIITLILNPYATQFLGFTAASVVFDVLARLIRHQNCLEKKIVSTICLLFVSVFSTATAGIIIGNLFIDPNLLTTMFGSVAPFALLLSLIHI